MGRGLAIPSACRSHRLIRQHKVMRPPFREIRLDRTSESPDSGEDETIRRLQTGKEGRRRSAAGAL